CRRCRLRLGQTLWRCRRRRRYGGRRRANGPRRIRLSVEPLEGRARSFDCAISQLSTILSQLSPVRSTPTRVRVSSRRILRENVRTAPPHFPPWRRQTFEMADSILDRCNDATLLTDHLSEANPAYREFGRRFCRRDRRVPC